LQTHGAKRGKAQRHGPARTDAKPPANANLRPRAGTGRHDEPIALDQVVKVRILAPQPRRARVGSGLALIGAVSPDNERGRAKPLETLRGLDVSIGETPTALVNGYSGPTGPALRSRPKVRITHRRALAREARSFRRTDSCAGPASCCVMRSARRMELARPGQARLSPSSPPRARGLPAQ
jgi:hypothetical protein